MTAPRRPAHAPDLAGYELVRLLGQGGFADVFLYQQTQPRRQVAIKVLLADAVGTDEVARLNDEADALAGLSQHQNIVTVFQSGVADDGRPYMVMEYYPRPSLAQGWRDANHSVAAVLSIGVQLAGAVESAHRLGILHRDIKPSNILVDRAGRPVLGDFGIATNMHEALPAAAGLSVPWSPPEALSAPPWAGPQSDVWGLAATLYSLLTGRAPFEIPGGDNKVFAQADRIRHAPYRPLGRPDAPSALDRVLATALAKEPAARYPSLRAFGLALRAVEQDLHLPPTRLEVIDDAAGYEAPAADDAGLTKRRPIRVASPLAEGTTTATLAAGAGGLAGGVAGAVAGADGPGADGPGEATAATAPAADDRTRLRPVAQVVAVEAAAPEPAAETAAAVAAMAAPATGRARWRTVVALAVAVALIGLIAATVWLGRGRTATPGGGAAASGYTPLDPLLDAPPVTGLDGLVEAGEARFTWENPDPAAGDRYRVCVITVSPKTCDLTDETWFDAPVPEGEATVCVEVETVRRSGPGSVPVQACAHP